MKKKIFNARKRKWIQDTSKNRKRLKLTSVRMKNAIVKKEKGRREGRLRKIVDRELCWRPMVSELKMTRQDRFKMGRLRFVSQISRPRSREIVFELNGEENLLKLGTQILRMVGNDPYKIFSIYHSLYDSPYDAQFRNLDMVRWPSMYGSGNYHDVTYSLNTLMETLVQLNRDRLTIMETYASTQDSICGQSKGCADPWRLKHV